MPPSTSPEGSSGPTNNDCIMSSNPDECSTSLQRGIPPESTVPRPKRIACALCRKRKLGCDGRKPACGKCVRLGHDCVYDEIRRKSGPKRGYVKQLEARLAQVERLLEGQELGHHDNTARKASADNNASNQNVDSAPFNDASRNLPEHNPSPGMLPNNACFTTPEQRLMSEGLGINNGDQFTWEVVGLGLDEPLPCQDVINELHQIYFEKIHPSIPMIHRPRYMAAFSLPLYMRPPICLRYIIWCHAASITEKYYGLAEIFYQRARKYIQADEMKGHGESTITVAHSQCWTLIATYEFKQMYFPRAWVSTGRGIRLAQMMALHRLDGPGLDVKTCLPAPRDWTEREERRRTFWMAYCEDKYASIGTGWPMIVDERDIMTNLPASEEAYLKSKPERTVTLQEAMTPDGASKVSAFAGVVLIAYLFGRNLAHLHRSSSNENVEDLENGEFWKRHRQLDHILLNIQLSLPQHLKVPDGISDPNIVFLNMSIHTSAICLHQAAIFKAEQSGLAPETFNRSRERCLVEAGRIVNLMRLVSGGDLTMMNPFLTFCLFAAARVFVQALKLNRNDQSIRTTLQFILTAMRAMTRQSPIAESFLVQLDVDLEGTGIDRSINDPSSIYGLNKGVPEGHGATEQRGCSGGLLSIPAELPRNPNVEESMSCGAHSTFANADQPSFSTSPNLPSRTRPLGTVSIPRAAMANVLPSDQDPSCFVDMSPGLLDMDLSADNDSEQRMSTSQSTPASSSHKGSSQTSATSPQSDDISMHNQYLQPSQQHRGSAPSLNPPGVHGFSGGYTYPHTTNSAGRPQASQPSNNVQQPPTNFYSQLPYGSQGKNALNELFVAQQSTQWMNSSELSGNETDMSSMNINGDWNSMLEQINWMDHGDLLGRDTNSTGSRPM